MHNRRAHVLHRELSCNSINIKKPLTLILLLMCWLNKSLLLYSWAPHWMCSLCRLPGKNEAIPSSCWALYLDPQPIKRINTKDWINIQYINLISTTSHPKTITLTVQVMCQVNTHSKMLTLVVRERSEVSHNITIISY